MDTLVGAWAWAVVLLSGSERLVVGTAWRLLLVLLL